MVSKIITLLVFWGIAEDSRNVGISADIVKIENAGNIEDIRKIVISVKFYLKFPDPGYVC